MSKLYHPLLTLIATATDRLLAHHLESLKEENRILRARIPKQIHTTPEERGRLLKLGKRLGKDIDALIGIVTPATFHRWVRAEERGRKRVKGSRPRRDLRELVRHIATGTDFGNTRIPGELRKLGIRRICRQTVKNILKEQGTDPRPKRGKGTWDEFVRIHAKTLWGPWCIPSKKLFLAHAFTFAPRPPAATSTGPAGRTQHDKDLRDRLS